MGGLDRFWLKSYPAGVAPTIDEREIGTLVQLLQDSFAQHGAKVAFACMGATLTYQQLDALSNAVASWLQSRGLVRGDRVAVMLPNVLQYPVVMAGILRAGCVVVNVNPLYKPRELEHQLADSGARAIFVLENFAATLAAVREHVPTDSVCVCRLGDLLGARGALVNFVVRHVRKLIRILRAGCVVVNVNPLYKPRELEHQLADSGARAIFVLENFAATLAAVREHVPTDSVCVCRLGDLLGARGALVNFVVRHVRKLI